MILKFYCSVLCLSLPFVQGSFVHGVVDRKDSNIPRSLIDFNNLKGADYSGYRLPTNLKPTDYYLQIQPFLSNSTFQGLVGIVFNVINETDKIVLNVRYESIIADSIVATVSLANGPPVSINNTTVDKEHQMIWFQLNTTLTQQQGAMIRIDYSGVLATDALGFYLSTYNTTDSHGQPTEHRVAVTQFEGTYARRAFPCFDEPAYRANFTIAIYRSPNQTSMSNMKLKENHTITSDLILDIYETSPPMPTYLVAFGVSDFAWQSDGGNIRVASRPQVIQDASFALSSGQPILYSIGNFTNVSYPLGKMDIVAVPDFSAGAMENWGLTTYREYYVLYNPKKNTQRDLYGVLSVIAHEFGHQWFGDLVTPEWWDYTWLNEAFATYFEYITPNQLYAGWNIGSAMYIDALQSALAEDIGNPRPMTSPVYTPDQIESIFDYVIYEKGGSVLRMIENFLTTPVWRDGLYRYLTNNAYKTGNPDELFSALNASAYEAKVEVASRVVATLISWTTQPGYPLVKVHKQTPTVYLVSQSPYELNNTDLRWSIPVTFTSQEEAQFDPTKAGNMLLYNTAETVSINTTGWVIFNVDQIGYYRVNYEEENWRMIIDQLNSNHSVIGTINRAQLLDDAHHLAKTGHLNYSTYMALTEYLPKETGFAPWSTFITNMRSLVNQFYNTTTGDELMKYTRSLISPPFQSLVSKLQSANPQMSFLESMTLQYAGQFACDMHLPDCEQMAVEAFQKWAQDPNNIVPETRQAVVCTQLRKDSGGNSFQSVLDYYLNSDNGAEKKSLLTALGCVSNAAAINKYLNVICDVNANHVRSQDRYYAIKALFSRQTAVGTGLQYLATNYDQVSQALGRKINAVFSTLGSTISQEAHIAQVMRLVNDTSVAEGMRDKLQTLVLPPVLKRQEWTRSPQAQQLISWVNHTTPSSASTPFSLSVVFVLCIAALTCTL